VWVLGKYSFQELLPHFFASAVYLHNSIYNSFSYVLPVAWSLEVEVQFYLLAPLLCCIYLVKSKYLRWCIFVALIIASGIYNYQFIMGTVVKFFCCFGIGMLVTDFYVIKQKFLFSSGWCFLIGIISLLIIVFVPTLTSYIGYWIKFFFTLMFLYIALTNKKWEQIFSNKYIAVIGGMCYSIYLLHFGILSVLGKLAERTDINLSNPLYIPVYFVLFAVCILVISSIYFLLVEKPFMKLKPKNYRTFVEARP
jgi:peptidoglycan/LPS O-acetylase OafA/YrhL